MGTQTVPLRSLWVHPLAKLVEAEYMETSVPALLSGNRDLIPDWTEERKGLSKLSYLLLDRLTNPDINVQYPEELSTACREVKNYLRERYREKRRQLRAAASRLPADDVRTGIDSPTGLEPSAGDILSNVLECMTLDDQTAWIESESSLGDEQLMA